MRIRSSAFHFKRALIRRIFSSMASGYVPFTPCFSFIAQILPDALGQVDKEIRALALSFSARILRELAERIALKAFLQFEVINMHASD